MILSISNGQFDFASYGMIHIKGNFVPLFSPLLSQIQHWGVSLSILSDHFLHPRDAMPHLLLLLNSQCTAFELPTSMELSAFNTVEIYHDHGWSKFTLPRNVVGNRGCQFTVPFITDLYSLLGIDPWHSILKLMDRLDKLKRK